MSNFSLEKFHEDIMFDKGVERYDRSFSSAEASGKLTPPEYSYMKMIRGSAIEEMEFRANTKLKYRPVEQWQQDILEIGVAQCVYLAIDILFHEMASSRKSDKATNTIVKVAEKIGKACLSQVVKDIKQTHDKEEMTRAIRLGVELINTLVSIPEAPFYLTDPEQQGIRKTQREIEPTPEYLDKLKDIYEDQRYSSPMFSPMVVPPKSILEGCYYDEKIASRMSISVTKRKSDLARIRESAVLGAPWCKAVDLIQGVGLKINTEMLAIVTKAYRINELTIDKDTGDRSRQFSKLPPSIVPSGLSKKETNEFKSLQGGFLGELAEAREYAKEEVIYLPAFVDFRGRVYAVPKLNHQSVDWMKSLWLFAEGKPIDTKEAGDWLKIHLANCGDFDKISKASFTGRMKWVDCNHKRIMDFAQDPFSDPDWFYEASEPFCFAAACMEYRKWMTQGDSYVCHLPIAVDGSNSGLQHFSAMARDTFTGSAVNLVPMDKPQDVYQVAANYLLELLEADKENPLAKEWLDFGISRKTTKRATMTICYGSRKGGLSLDKNSRKMKTFGWTDQLMTDIVAGKEGRFTNPTQACVYLANHLDTVLRKIAPKPMEVMDWLQKVAGVLCKLNRSVSWVTPAKFPVNCAYYKQKEAKLDILIRGRRHQIKFAYGTTDKLVSSKQRNALAPNFVHSCDAAHLQMTAINSKAEGIDSFLLIHDSFACLPSDMSKFHRVVRNSFVEMYQNWDALKELYIRAIQIAGVENAHKIPPPPDYGDLDLEDMKDSQYAFA